MEGFEVSSPNSEGMMRLIEGIEVAASMIGDERCRSEPVRARIRIEAFWRWGVRSKGVKDVWI